MNHDEVREIIDGYLTKGECVVLIEKLTAAGYVILKREEVTVAHNGIPADELKAMLAAKESHDR